MATVRIYDTEQNTVLSIEKIEKPDAEWKQLLTNKQYEITTRKGTEAPGSRSFDEVQEPGIFRCVRCGIDLFRSSAKFESGTGLAKLLQTGLVAERGEAARLYSRDDEGRSLLCTVQLPPRQRFR